jgi:hypothetical protein
MYWFRDTSSLVLLQFPPVWLRTKGSRQMKAHSLPADDGGLLLPRAGILHFLYQRLYKRPGDADIDGDGSAGFYPVKRLILAVAMVFGWASAAWAAGPPH